MGGGGDAPGRVTRGVGETGTLHLRGHRDTYGTLCIDPHSGVGIRSGGH